MAITQPVQRFELVEKARRSKATIWTRPRGTEAQPQSLQSEDCHEPSDVRRCMSSTIPAQRIMSTSGQESGQASVDETAITISSQSHSTRNSFMHAA